MVFVVEAIRIAGAGAILGHIAASCIVCFVLLCDILAKSRECFPQRSWKLPYLDVRMLPLAELTLWLLTTLVEAFVVFLFLIQGLFRKFLLLNIYLLFSVTISMGRFAVLYHFGFTSSEYAYFYYFTDALLSLFLFLSLCELSVRLVGTKMARRKAGLWGAGALLATSWFSFLVVLSRGTHVTTRFAAELSQNIFFVCCLAIVLLWVWKLRNYPEDRIAARFVSVLSVYFSLFVLMYGAHQLVPQVSSLISNLAPMMGAWLPLGCGFVLVSAEQH